MNKFIRALIAGWGAKKIGGAKMKINNKTKTHEKSTPKIVTIIPLYDFIDSLF